MIHIVNDYKTTFLNKLSLRDRRLIELYEQHNFGARHREEALIECEQLGLFETAPSNVGGKDNHEVDGEDTRIRTRQVAGFKAAKTRQRNVDRRSRARKSRGPVANYERSPNAKKRGPAVPDDKIDSIIIQAVLDNPGKFNTGHLTQLIPGTKGRVTARIHRLHEEGKIRLEGVVRKFKNRAPGLFGKWFPA